MGRWARGNEISCSSGACRLLAEYLVMSDTGPGHNWPVCWQHKDSLVKIVVKVGQARNPEVVPFQDPFARPPKRKTRPKS